METNQRLRKFLVEELAAKAEDVKADDSPLISSLVVDSLGPKQIVSFLEDELGLMVSEGEIVPENFETIGGITRLVESKRG